MACGRLSASTAQQQLCNYYNWKVKGGRENRFLLTKNHFLWCGTRRSLSRIYSKYSGGGGNPRLTVGLTIASLKCRRNANNYAPTKRNAAVSSSAHMQRPSFAYMERRSLCRLVHLPSQRIRTALGSQYAKCFITRTRRHVHCWRVFSIGIPSDLACRTGLLRNASGASPFDWTGNIFASCHLPQREF